MEVFSSRVLKVLPRYLRGHWD